MSKYSGRVQPLQLLRNYTMQKKRIKSKENVLLFDNLKFKLKTQTPWLSTQTKKQYDLGSLWLFLDSTQKNLNNIEYLQKSTQLGVQYVNVADHEQILAYFNGKVDTTPAINNELRIEINQRMMRRDEKEDETKKPRQEEEIVDNIHFKVIDWMMRFQRPLTNAKKMLETPSKSYRDVLRNIKQGQSRNQVVVHKKTKLAQIYENKGQPIIIVPDTSQPGNVCIKNIRRLLQNGEYVQASNCQDLPMRKIQVTHRMRQRNIIFQITNNPTLLTHSQWQNVIAIFALGRNVQFNGWPQTNVNKLFAKYRGFFVKYDRAKVTELRDWNVKIINVQQMTRAEDSEVAKGIWEEFEKILFASVE